MELENIIEKPFENGTYYFNLNWKGIKIGDAELTFLPINEDSLPEKAKDIRNSGELYKVTFNGILNLPVLNLILKSGSYTSYIQIHDKEVKPLLSSLELKLLNNGIISNSIYDYENNKLVINDKLREIDKNKMKLLKDPVSHVINLLFKSRKSEGNYFVGYFSDKDGNLHELDLKYNFEDRKLVGTSHISAGAYFLNVGVILKLPYSFNEKKELFMPSLKENVSISAKYLGKVEFEFVRFRN